MNVAIFNILIVVPLETSSSLRIEGYCKLQKHEARERRHKDQDWEEVISIGRRSRKNRLKHAGANCCMGCYSTEGDDTVR